MQERQLFEYAVIRIVPRVDREEFLNVGVVLYCSKQKFLQALYTLDQERLTIFSKAIDLEEVEKYLVSFQKICHGGREGGPIGQLPIAERFRWLTAVRSTVVQTSPVHPGLCMDAEETIHNLFDRLVL
ncbi:MAG TPA: DUF3037 domain-containing protein [Cyclobacteriaceae bacterium]|nr:DUF3037 domain-containing protein [Cyclobacteriaceae bacterium]